MIKFTPADEMDRNLELLFDGADETDIGPNLEPESQLVRQVHSDWERAAMAKQTIEQDLLSNFLAFSGEYSDEKLAELRESGFSTLYSKLSAAKIRTAAAHIMAVLLPETKTSHGIEPTAEPELPPWMKEQAAAYLLQNPDKRDEDGNVIPMEQQSKEMQDALRAALRERSKRAARNMERKMQDQMQEGGWYDALAQMIYDVCIYRTGFLKGPYFVTKPRIKWTLSEDGSYNPKVVDRKVPTFSSIDPFDAYPAPGSSTIQDDYFIERLHLTRRQLDAYRNDDNVIEENLDWVMENFDGGWLSDWLWREIQQDNQWLWCKAEVDGLVWYGHASGSELKDAGVKGKFAKKKIYKVELTLISNKIIKAIVHKDPMYKFPIGFASYQKLPGNVWGLGVADLCEDSQDMVNSCSRALQNNLAFASGFQVEVDYERLSPHDDPSNIYPFKVWQSRESDRASSPAPAVRFFAPPSNANELLGVMSHFLQQADMDSGIPAFLNGGENNSVNARIAGMLKEDSARILRLAIRNIDEGACKPALTCLYNHNMITSDDETIKGDCQVVPKGVNAAVQKTDARTQHMALLEILNNPEDRMLLGEEKRINAIRNLVATFEEVDVDDYIPTPEEVQEKLRAAAAAPPPPDYEMLKMDLERELTQLKIRHDAQMEELRLSFERDKLLVDRGESDKDRQNRLEEAKLNLEKQFQTERTKAIAARYAAFESGDQRAAEQRIKAATDAALQAQKLEHEKEMELIKQGFAVAQAERMVERSPSADVEEKVQQILQSLDEEREESENEEPQDEITEDDDSDAFEDM